MKHVLILIAVFFFSSLSVHAEEPIRERIEWADVWVTDADKDDLPRVLMIGDSITRGYFGEVEKHLAGKAYCARLATSKCVSAPSFIEEMQLLLKHYRFDAIHFNNGLHGWDYTEEQYRKGLVETVEAIRTQAGDDKLIWATTTPVRDPSDLQQFAERTERVEARNKIAGEIMKERQIPANNLFTLVEDHPEWYSSDGTHFNGQGKAAQGKQVADSLLKLLFAKGPDGQ